MLNDDGDDDDDGEEKDHSHEIMEKRADVLWMTFQMLGVFKHFTPYMTQKDSYNGTQFWFLHRL